MYTLHIDTSRNYTYVLLSMGKQLLFSKKSELEHKHAESLFVLVDELKDQYPLVDIDSLHVIAGPGSYTGLKVAYSFINSFALARGIKTIYQSSVFDLMYVQNNKISGEYFIHSRANNYAKVMMPEVVSSTNLTFESLDLTDDLSFFFRSSNSNDLLSIHIDMDFVINNIDLIGRTTDVSPIYFNPPKINVSKRNFF